MADPINKKTTLFLSRSLYRKLVKLSKITEKSMGELLREAAEQQYFSAPSEKKIKIVREMATMQIPVGRPEEIESEIEQGRLEVG